MSINAERRPILTRRAAATTALLAAALLAPAVRAEEPRWEATLVGGAGFGSRVYTSNTAEVRIGNSGLWGARLGYALGPSFRLEAGWTHANADLLARSPSTSGSNEKAGSVTTDAWEVNALYDFGGKATRGYLGLGIGVLSIAPALPTLSDSETRFAANAAIGVRQLIGSRFSLRAEGRYRWRDGRTRVGTIVCDGECKPFTTNWYSSAELTAGASVRF